MTDNNFQASQDSQIDPILHRAKVVANMACPCCSCEYDKEAEKGIGLTFYEPYGNVERIFCKMECMVDYLETLDRLAKLATEYPQQDFPSVQDMFLMADAAYTPGESESV